MNFINMDLTRKEGKLYASFHHFEFELPPIENQAELPESGEVLIGIRPSALIPTDSDEALNVISFNIDVSEYVGTQSVLISEIQGQRFMAEVDSLHDFNLGETVRFKVEPKDIYVFDRKTERTIY